MNLSHLEDHSELYLYGDPSINGLDNKKIILATIKYIKETRRFSTQAWLFPPVFGINVICFLIIICMCVLFFLRFFRFIRVIVVFF